MQLRTLAPQAVAELEQANAASARALSGAGDLGFRGHRLTVGTHRTPVLAAHARFAVDEDDLIDLRGYADHCAMRVRHSDVGVYRTHRPSTEYAQLLYEYLEQFRVEALADRTLPGLRSNLSERFRRWLAACMNAGLADSELGILTITVLVVCRSRIVNEAIDEHLEGRLEATRAGIYPVLGPGLRQLRPIINDQDAFDRIASDIAIAISELAGPTGGSGTSRAALTEFLALMGSAQDSDLGHDVTSPESKHSPRSPDSYAVFTRDFDETCLAENVVPRHTLLELRHELSALTRDHGWLSAYLVRRFTHLFNSDGAPTWRGDAEQGLLDPAHVTRIITDHNAQRVYRAPQAEPATSAAVTFLIDCSGSMKARIAEVAVFVELATRALAIIGVETEVLGYTTRSWNGGRSRHAWQQAGRPIAPGRLNEVRHIVFKSSDMAARRSRMSMATLLWTPMFREGIDGEAVQWAADRLRETNTEHKHLILISDGSPMDGATQLANGERYLDTHLAEVVAQIEQDGTVRIAGLGIGHDMTSYCRSALTVDQILTRSTAATLVALLGGKRIQNFDSQN